MNILKNSMVADTPKKRKEEKKMKQSEIDAILEDEGLSTAEKRAKLQALNGRDINAAKDSVNQEYAQMKSEYEELKKNKDSYNEKLATYKDYEELKSFKETTLKKEERNKQLKYLDDLGFKHSELIADKVDFSKAKFNPKTNKYEGIDEKALCEKYGDLMVDTKSQKQSFAFSGTAGASDTNTNDNESINNWLRG